MLLVAQQQPRLREYLRADDERPFLDRAFGDALHDADRLRYADLLEARDPGRAEWLRLEVALHARATGDPAVLARFIELASAIGLDFANLLLRDKIMNCGAQAATAQPPRARFAVTCSKRWQTLAPTESDGVRMCQQCAQPVYRCDTVAEAETRAFAGQCIAIPKPLTDGGIESMVLGRPDPVAIWADRLFSIGPRRGGEAERDHLIVLYSRDEALVGRSFFLGAGPTIEIGRGTDNNIVLNSDGISRSHARLERRADGWWLVDHDSTNGIYVGGQQVHEAPLRDGDRFQLGDTVLQFTAARR